MFTHSSLCAAATSPRYSTTRPLTSTTSLLHPHSLMWGDIAQQFCSLGESSSLSLCCPLCSLSSWWSSSSPVTAPFPYLWMRPPPPVSLALLHCHRPHPKTRLARFICKQTNRYIYHVNVADVTRRELRTQSSAWGSTGTILQGCL